MDKPAEATPVDEVSVVEKRLEQITLLLEEIVDDNTSVVAAMNRLSSAQTDLGSDVVREVSALRGELTSALVHRTLKDLCVELIGPLAAMEAMLDRADFSDPDVIAGHVRALSVTLRGVLSRMGAMKIPIAVGEEPFDPHRHRCVGLVEPDDSPFPEVAARTVVRVAEDGYLLGNRLLIPAAVEIQAGRAATGTDGSGDRDE